MYMDVPKCTSCHKAIMMMMIKRACCIKIMHLYYVHPDLSILRVYIYIYIYYTLNLYYICKRKSTLHNNCRRTISNEYKDTKVLSHTKINKENNPGRAVINSVNCHTSEISGFVDHHLQPLVKQISSKIPMIL